MGKLAFGQKGSVKVFIYKSFVFTTLARSTYGHLGLNPNLARTTPFPHEGGLEKTSGQVGLLEKRHAIN